LLELLVLELLQSLFKSFRSQLGDLVLL
jgi:hypothetical protein